MNCLHLFPSPFFAAAVVCAAAFPFCATAEFRATDGANAVQLVTQVQEAESKREAELHKIVSTRRYVLKNKRWEKDAIMHVRAISEIGVGKRFEIISIENADGLQKRVFQKLIEGEMEGARKDDPNAESSLNFANYDFTLLGTDTLNGRQCVVLQLRPKRSSKYLIDGKAWVDPIERAFIRVEGRTAKSVSFWIGKPYIVQNFRKVEDVWVSASNQSICNVKLLGKTELTVEFDGYELGRQNKVARNPRSPKKP